MTIHINHLNAIVEGFRNGSNNQIIRNLDLYLKMIISGKIAPPIFFHHPLGFIYSKIHNDKLRLHIWNSHLSEIKTSLDIHTHYYRITSLIYRGSITNETFIEDELKCDKNKYFIYNVEYHNEDRKLVKSDNLLYLKMASKENIPEKELYNIELDTFHRAHPSNKELTITVIYTENHGKPSPVVVGDKDAINEYYFETIEVNVKDVVSVIDGVINKNF